MQFWSAPPLLPLFSVTRTTLNLARLNNFLNTNFRKPLSSAVASNHFTCSIG
jgi:hypothetical protein